MGMTLNPKSEGRNPKEIRRPKSEGTYGVGIREEDGSEVADSEFGFRPSFGFRVSGFGFLHLS
jgi:hypothetical protein